MEITSPNHPLDSLIFLTKRVGKLLSLTVRDQLGNQAPEILPQHMGVLVDLWMKDGVRQVDLAVSVIKDKATITRTLNQLERMDILVRVPDQLDKRNKRIFLTYKGQALKQDILPGAQQIMDDLLRELPPQQVDVCKSVLLFLYQKLSLRTYDK